MLENSDTENSFLWNLKESTDKDYVLKSIVDYI